MRLAEVGKYLLYEAIWVADEQDDRKFFKEAFGLWQLTDQRRAD
jgi:hypothetical protein